MGRRLDGLLDDPRPGAPREIGDAATLKSMDAHLILDNYGTHKTLSIRRWLMRHPRYQQHFTPTSASWINLVERWFATLTERHLRRGVHRSTAELEAALLR